MKLAFSTVACPDSTLERVAQLARSCGYSGVELRTFGYGSTQFACDPALSSPTNVQTLLRTAGAEPCCLASSCRFDAMVTPPVLGWVLGDPDQSVREAKTIVELAANLGCPLVRVFGFEYPGRERRVRAIDRIASRLWNVCDAARARSVRIVVENGGSFVTAAQLAELLDAVDHPSVGAAYSVAVGASGGDDPALAINVLGERMLAVKLRDYAAGKPCAIGDGSTPCEPAVRTLAAAGYDGWVTVEYDRAWTPGLGDPAPILARSAERFFNWLAPSGGRRTPTPTPALAGAR